MRRRGTLLFPRADGEMRTEADKLGKRIRTALNHAGIVESYLHICRRCKDRPPAEAREICCIRGNQALLEAAPEARFPASQPLAALKIMWARIPANRRFSLRLRRILRTGCGRY